MINIIQKLDFLKGRKTIIASAFTMIAIVLNVFGVDATSEELTDIFFQIINQLEVIFGAAGIVYGLVMKVVRKFAK